MSDSVATRTVSDFELGAWAGRMARRSLWTFGLLMFASFYPEWNTAELWASILGIAIIFAAWAVGTKAMNRRRKMTPEDIGVASTPYPIP